tara:strand:- start:386 stop:925 length:540 start_codon:yes stop_codon:yes gene_type:complete
MNRYQFEDLISEYIENELSLSKRKEFEIYLNENPDSVSIIESVKLNLQKTRSLPKVKASSDFNEKLFQRIKSNSSKLINPELSNHSIFGFTPIHASMFTGLVIAIIFTSIQLFYPQSMFEFSGNDNFVSKENSELSNPSQQVPKILRPDIVDSHEDSTSSPINTKPKKDFSKKIRLVND